MDDLNEKLDRLLSDPSTVAKMQAMLTSLSDKNEPSPPPAPEEATAALPDGAKDAALLKALRPYLHGEREKKLDEAIKLMELSRLLPLLRS